MVGMVDVRCGREWFINFEVTSVVSIFAENEESAVVVKISLVDGTCIEVSKHYDFDEAIKAVRKLRLLVYGGKSLLIDALRVVRR